MKLILITILLSSLCSALEASPFIHFGRCVSNISEIAHCMQTKDCEYIQQNAVDKANIEELAVCSNSADRTLICCPKLIPSKNAIKGITLTSRGSFDMKMLPEPPYCGLMLSNRIYGATGRGFYCGGTLINERWVLTAAHCITGPGLRPGWRVTGVRLGEFHLDTDPDCIEDSSNEDCAPPHIDVLVDRQLPHPLFNTRKRTSPHDIALLRLARSIQATQFVKPICLPVQESMRTLDFVGTRAEVSGWGRTENNNNPSKIKLKALVDVWNNTACHEKYLQYDINIIENHVCAGGVVGVDACGGDSGGPLLLDWPSPKGKAFFQIGVVTFGKLLCGNSDTPGVYTRVGPYIDWIGTTIADNS